MNPANSNTNPDRPHYQAVEVYHQAPPPIGSQTVQHVPPQFTNDPANPVASMINTNSSPSKKHINKFLFLIPAVLLLAAIFLAAFLASRLSQTKKTPLSSPIPTPTLIPSTPAPTPVPIIRNKSYQNQNHNFYFNYPETYRYFECQNTIKIYSKDTLINEDEIICNNLPLGIVEITYATKPLEYQENPSDEISESLVKIDGLDEVIAKTINKKIIYLNFDNQNIYYLIVLNSIEQKSLFDQILKSFKFIEVVTDEWQTYTNTSVGFKFQYPPDWITTASANINQILVKPEKTSSQSSLTIEAQGNIAEVELTASEVVNSTKNLPGWKKTPSVDIQSIDKGTAQILQGQLGSIWQIFAAIWYKNRLIQLIWQDSLDQANQQTFGNILSTFEFLD